MVRPATESGHSLREGECILCFTLGKQDVNGCEHRVGKRARNVLKVKVSPAPGPFGQRIADG
jgi:hypothetical protein